MSRVKVDVIAGGSLLRAGAEVPDGVNVSPQYLEGGDGDAPPRSGRGSGEEAWREYAASLDVDVPAEAGRDDIIAALEAAGKIPAE